MEYVKQNWTSKIVGKIKRHKFISTVVFAFGIFSSFNIVMIYQFMKILQNV